MADWHFGKIVMCQSITPIAINWTHRDPIFAMSEGRVLLTRRFFSRGPRTLAREVMALV